MHVLRRGKRNSLDESHARPHNQDMGAAKTDDGKRRMARKGQSLAIQRQQVEERVSRAAALLVLAIHPHDVRAVLKIEYGVHWGTADRYIAAAKQRIQANDDLPAPTRRWEYGQQLRQIAANPGERTCDKIRAIEALIDLHGVSLSKQQQTANGDQHTHLHVHYEVVTPEHGKIVEGPNMSTCAVDALPARIGSSSSSDQAETRPAV